MDVSIADDVTKAHHDLVKCAWSKDAIFIWISKKSFGNTSVQTKCFKCNAFQNVNVKNKLQLRKKEL
jgi:hypothetical protein